MSVKIAQDRMQLKIHYADLVGEANADLAMSIYQKLEEMPDERRLLAYDSWLHSARKEEWFPEALKILDGLPKWGTLPAVFEGSCHGHADFRYEGTQLLNRTARYYSNESNKLWTHFFSKLPKVP